MTVTEHNSTSTILPPAKWFPWPFIAVDCTRLSPLVASCRHAGVSYHLGSKARSGTSKPGVNFTQIDCSGMVGWLLYNLTGGGIDLCGRGSVEQREYIEARGFKRSTPEACEYDDGILRIAFLDPHDTPGHIGHVVLVWNGETYESHGGKGPDMRIWTGTGWQAKTRVFVLTAPVGI